MGYLRNSLKHSNIRGWFKNIFILGVNSTVNSGFCKITERVSYKNCEFSRVNSVGLIKKNKKK